eukprot:5293390-Amphidinium_carterae.1
MLWGVSGGPNVWTVILHWESFLTPELQRLRFDALKEEGPVACSTVAASAKFQNLPICSGRNRMNKNKDNR